MKLTRRDALTLGLGATAAQFLPSRAGAATEDAILQFTNGAEPLRNPGLIRFRHLERLADVVEVEVVAPDCTTLALFVQGATQPEIARATFGPNTQQRLKTRARTNGGTGLVAVARDSSGGYVRAQVRFDDAL